MEQKRKAALAAAAGALLVAVACSAARCAVAGVSDVDGGGDAVQEQEGGDSGMTAEEKALAALCGHSWQAEGDAAKTVTFREGSFVEADGAGVAVTAFDVTGATEWDDQVALDVGLVREGDFGPGPSELIVEGAEGSLRVTCDGFANAPSYVECQEPGGEVAVTGLEPAFVEIAGGDEDAVREAVASYCRAHAPSARTASFDGEVYWDMADGRVSATFHLDDAGRSIVTVSYADGALTVMG